MGRKKGGENRIKDGREEGTGCSTWGRRDEDGQHHCFGGSWGLLLQGANRLGPG